MGVSYFLNVFLFPLPLNFEGFLATLKVILFQDLLLWSHFDLCLSRRFFFFVPLGHLFVGHRFFTSTWCSSCLRGTGSYLSEEGVGEKMIPEILNLATDKEV